MFDRNEFGFASECQSQLAPIRAAVSLEPLEARQLLAATLDDSFGDDGVAEVGRMTKFVIAPDDKIVSIDGRTITRRTADGEVDVAFGGGDGTVETDFTIIRGVAVQQDGKIVVVGHRSRAGIGDGGAFRVARYTSTGKLDKTFNGDGIYTKAFGGKPARSFASDVTIQPNGKIVVVGRGTLARAPNASALVVMRLKANGRLDKTFNDKGFSASYSGNLGGLGHEAEGLDVEVAPDGKIVVGGVSGMSAVVVRYDRDGNFDRTFGEDGMAGHFNIFSLSLDVQRDGKIVVAGTAKESMADNGDRVVRLTASGELDESFGGGDGVVQDLFEVHDAYSSSSNDVLALPDGGILVTGWNEDRSTDVERATLTRLNPDGSIDREFTGGGRYVEVPLDGREQANDLAALQRDGRIIFSGVATADRHMLARYIIEDDDGIE